MGPVLRGFLLLFSQVFHAILGLFLTGLGVVAWLTGKHTLRLDILPWEGAFLTCAVLILGVYALVSAWLSVFAGTRTFLAVQAIVTAGLLIRGILFSPMPLNGNPLDWSTALLLLLASLLALAGVVLGPKREDRRRVHE